MPGTYRLVPWQTFGLLLFFGLVTAGWVPAKVGTAGEHSVPSESEPNYAESSDPWKPSSGGVDILSSPDGYITSSDLAPASDAKKPLFSNGDFKELAEKVGDFLDAYSTFTAIGTPTSQPTTSFASIITHAPVVSEAILGCSIFYSYMSLCAPATISNPQISGSPDPRATESAIASCACYSATFYVPDALDNAVSACAGYPAADKSSMHRTDLAPLATSAPKMEGFCSGMGNVRNYATARFGEATAKITATSSMSSAPPLSTHNSGHRLASTDLSLWSSILAILLV